MVRAGLGVAMAAMMTVPAAARGQAGVATEGALFLLVPTGASAIGQGQTGVAVRRGADGTWTNPASIAWASYRELSVDHAATTFISGNALDAQLPMGPAGVLGASALLFNLGDQGATDEFGNTIGTIYLRALVASTTYAATFGDNFAAGITYKYVQQSQECSGACQNQTTFSVSTSAFDAGIQLAVGDSGRVRFGLGVRNLGFGLQTVDKEQTDPLPTRFVIGTSYLVAAVERALPGASLRLSADAVTRGSLARSSLRAGAEFSLADRIFIRGGALTSSADRTAASVGFGYRQGLMSIDLARAFGGISADAGEPPTYITLRFGFR